jgi:hypothetical protein
MTARPHDHEIRRRPIYGAVALVLVMAAVLLAAGCVELQSGGKNMRIRGNGQFTDNQAGSVLATPTPYERITEKTIPQPNDSHADYVKMLKDIYNPGEEIKFYLVNDENSLMSCYNWEPHYYVSNILENGTNIQFIGPTGMIQPGINYLGPGESSRVFNLNTTNWTPGLFNIRFDCGGVNRQFRIVEYP